MPLNLPAIIPGEDIWGQQINDNLEYLDGKVGGSKGDKGDKGAPGVVDDASMASVARDGASEFSQAVAVKIAQAVASNPTVSDAAAAALSDALYNARTTKNLYNPADPDVLNDTVPTSTPGAYTTLANYRTSGFIPVTASAAYTIENIRYYEWYDEAKVSRGQATNTGSTGADVTITAPGAGFLRVTYFYTAWPNLQVEAGTVATAYEPYFPGTIESIDPQFASAVASAMSIYAPPLTLQKVGNALTITTALAGTALVQSASLNGSANGAFSLTGTSHGGVSVTGGSDEVTPIRTQLGTVGANHGYACVASFTNPDGKTAADLGSVWTDTAGREYVLLAIDAGRLIIGGSYVKTAGLVTSVTVAPATNLTHVAGATKTGAIAFGTQATAQLYPSIGRPVVTVKADGALAPEGSTAAAQVVVNETYDILDYAAIYDAAKANKGVSFATRNLAGCVRVSNTFRWTGPVCKIATSYTELLPTELGVYGGVQAVAFAKGSATMTRYLPGVGTVGGFNWTNGVDMTSYSTSVIIRTADLTGTQPPAFCLDMLGTSASPVLGFAIGYLPFGERGDEDSRNSARLANASDRLWDMRSTKKSYPTVSTLTAPGWGRRTISAFRAYLEPSRVSAVLASKDNALTAWEALGIEQS